MSQPEKPFEFVLYDCEVRYFPMVQEHIQNGTLPFDTLFRLANIGVNELDPTNNDEYKMPTWRWGMYTDVAVNGADSTTLRFDTQHILFGPAPELVVDLNKRHNYPGYSR